MPLPLHVVHPWDKLREGRVAQRVSHQRLANPQVGETRPQRGNGRESFKVEPRSRNLQRRDSEDAEERGENV